MTTLLFDVRNHLPSRPLKGWSLPVADPTEPDTYRIDTARYAILVKLQRSRTLHTLVVALWPYAGEPPIGGADVTRVLRRFRCRGPFAEYVAPERNQSTQPGAAADTGVRKHMRIFHARAKLGSGEMWPKVERRDERFDVRNHLPLRPPEGWSLPTTDPRVPEGYRIDTADLMVLTRLERGRTGRGFDLSVGVMRFEGTTPIRDEEAAGVFAHLRAHGPFEERTLEMANPVPWLRAYLATAEEGNRSSWAEVHDREGVRLRSVPPRGWLVVERSRGEGIVFAREHSTLRMRAVWIAADDFRLIVWHDGGEGPPSDAEVKDALARNKGPGDTFEEQEADLDAPLGARQFARRALPSALN